MPRSPHWTRPMKKLLLRLGAGLAVLLLVAAATVWLALRASLPVLDGRVATHAIGERVTIERDAEGAVTISGRARNDVVFGLGYAHA